MPHPPVCPRTTPTPLPQTPGGTRAHVDQTRPRTCPWEATTGTRTGPEARPGRKDLRCRGVAGDCPRTTPEGPTHGSGTVCLDTEVAMDLCPSTQGVPSTLGVVSR